MTHGDRSTVRRTTSALLLAGLCAGWAPMARAEIVVPQSGDWQLALSAKATACIPGRCASDGDRETNVQYLSEGTILRLFIQVWSCNIALDEFGSFVPRNDVKSLLRLKKPERLPIQDLLQECSPYPRLGLFKAAGTEKVFGDGFVSRATLGFNVKQAGQRVAVTVVVTLKGTLLGAGDASTEASAAPLDLPDLVDAVIAEAIQKAR